MYDTKEIFNENSKIPSFFKKIILKFFKANSNIILKENIIILPYTAEEVDKITSTKFLKYFKKINTFLNSENIKTIAISKNLNFSQHIETFKNCFYAKNYNILDGRWLFKYLSFNILEYISQETNTLTNDLEVSVLINATNEFSKETIRLLAQNIKRLNIVTQNMEYFKPLAQELYNSFGISIRISNNKKKILTKSNIIFNFDFPEEVINKFTLPLKRNTHQLFW